MSGTLIISTNTGNFGKQVLRLEGTAGGGVLKGSWDANTNTPTLVSSVGDEGDAYIVNTAGSTNLNGITTWNVSDWVVFSGGVWTRVPATEVDEVQQYANRDAFPGTGNTAVVYIATDTGIMYSWNGANYLPVNATGVYVRVKATENINKGQPVKITGYNAGENALEIALANQATGVSNGLSVQNLTTGSFGYVIQAGLLEGFDTSSFSEGIILYVDGTGALTATEPTSGFSQPIAYVLRSHATNGAVQVNADYPKQRANDVMALNHSGSTYNTVQDMQNLFHSSGYFGSSSPLITDNLNGTIDIAQGEYALRTSDSNVADLLFITISAQAGLALTDAQENYVYADYNSGTPIYTVTTTKSTDYNTKALIASIYRNGTTLYINETKRLIVGDHAGLMVRRMNETMPFQRVSGAMLSETGTRNIAVTAGTFWEGLTKFTTAAFDSSGVDTFDYFYRDGVGGWTKTTGNTQIDNINYDNGTGTLAALSNNRYGVHWVYIGTDSDVYVLYGRGDYTLVDAENATVPSDIPQEFSGHSRIIGKIIIQKSASVFTEIFSAFTTTFELSQISDHNSLTNLQGGAANEYYHVTAAKYAELLNVTVPNTAITLRKSYVGTTDPTTTDDSTLLFDYGSVWLNTATDTVWICTDPTASNALWKVVTVSAASDTAQGIVELATIAETDTGTDATRAVTPDGLQGSKYVVRYPSVRVIDSATDVAVATTVGGDLEIPVTGTITGIGAYVDTAGVTGTMTVDVNLNGATLMTTNKITIDDGEKSSRTAATAPALTTTAVTAGDVITVDVDAIQTTAAKGLTVWLSIRE